MSGYVVSRSPQQHPCDPQWKKMWHEHVAECSEVVSGFGSVCVNKALHPEQDGCWIYHPRDEPEGTVFQCECGNTFVSLGCGPWNNGRTTSFECRWRPEGRIERWKRRRNSHE